MPARGRPRAGRRCDRARRCRRPRRCRPAASRRRSGASRSAPGASARASRRSARRAGTRDPSRGRASPYRTRRRSRRRGSQRRRRRSSAALRRGACAGRARALPRRSREARRAATPSRPRVLCVFSSASTDIGGVQNSPSFQYGRAHLLGADPSAVAGEAARLEARVVRGAAELGDHDVRALLDDQLAAALAEDRERDLVAHRRGRQVDRFFVPEERRCAALELEDGRDPRAPARPPPPRSPSPRASRASASSRCRSGDRSRPGETSLPRMADHDPYTLPPDLPVPEDDGGADHLTGAELPHVTLDSTQGPVDVAGARRAVRLSPHRPARASCRSPAGTTFPARAGARRSRAASATTRRSSPSSARRASPACRRRRSTSRSSSQSGTTCRSR